MARIRDVAGLTSLACALAMGAASACTTFTSDEPAGTGDAGGDENQAPGLDGGASEAAADGDAARRPGSCPGVDATFCDNFDHGEPLGNRWRFGGITADASLGVSDASARSAPLSLRIFQERADASFIAQLAEDVPTFVDRFFMSFDLLYVELPTGGTFLLETKLTPLSEDQNQSNAVGPRLAAFPVTAGVELRAWNWADTAGGAFGQSIGRIMVGQWTHVEISFQPSPDSAGFSLETFSVGGNESVTRKVASELAVAKPSLFLGARSGMSRTNIHFDNVVIDAH
jgi:hypothetical protein